MSTRGELLRSVMEDSGTSQVRLSRVSGVRQPSISQFVTGKVDLSDDQLDRLLSCMGYRLEVVRRPVSPPLTRSEERSWRLHRHISSLLTNDSLVEIGPLLRSNLDRLGRTVTGQPHQRHLEEWSRLVDSGDLRGVQRVLTGLDRRSIEMREVSPMSGVLSEQDRLQVLAKAG